MLPKKKMMTIDGLYVDFNALLKCKDIQKFQESLANA